MVQVWAWWNIPTVVGTQVAAGGDFNLCGGSQSETSEALCSGVRDLCPDPCPSISSSGSSGCIINSCHYAVEKLAVGV